MDRERFGRALGQGAREAAKALLKAADAAASTDRKSAGALPPRSYATGHTAGRQVRQAAPPAAAAVKRRVVEAKTTGAGLKRGGKRFGEAIWGPFARLSSQLWHELTGVFFALFALTAAVDLVRHHNNLLLGGEPARRAWFAVAMLAVFGYFAISSFVRAARRGRSR